MKKFFLFFFSVGRVVETVTCILLATLLCRPLSAQDVHSWPGVFDPLHVATLNFELDPAVWEDIKRDTNYYDPILNIRVPCLMWADGETNKLLVQIRRKSDPAQPSEADPQKVSLKIDINEFVTGQEWRGLKKLSLESGGGGNGVVREGLAMNIHRFAAEHGAYDYQAGYSAWVRVVVNSNYVGLYSSPEQRDKQFLRNRGMYKPGASWLYEINPGTTLDTTVATTNSPTYNTLCFSPFRTACAQPSNPSLAIAMETNLNAWVDLNGMLTVAAIEQFIANTDGLFTKNGKNSFAVDFLPSQQRKRQYYPWDLDAGFSNTSLDIYTGGPGQASSRKYQVDILGHYWFRQQYRHIFSDLLDGPLNPAMLTPFLNQIEAVLTPYLLEDPNANIGDPAGHFASIRQYFTNRAANVRGQIGALAGPVRFSRSGGEFVPGLQLSLTHTNTSGTIYYTLDGTDPRGVGSVVAGATYTGPLTLTNSAHITARVLSGTNWSALRQATFNVAGHANGIKITEIMYRPKAISTNDDAGDYEFIELKNIGSTPVNLSRCYFTGIDFTFAAGTIVPPGGFVVLVKNPAAFAARYPSVSFHGVYFGGLSSTGEKIRLRNSDGNNIVSVAYDDDPPWPQGANGFGYSLVNINPDGAPDDPQNWRASTQVHGSPGADDPSPPYGVGVVVNEVLTHTDAPQEDAIELYNPTASDINIGGWYLSDQMDLLDLNHAALKKYRIPAGTIVPAGGYKTFYENAFNPGTTNANAQVKFAFSKFGEEVWLSSADGAGNLTGHIIGFRFGAADNGVAIGRHRTSTGHDVTFLERPTFGVANPASKSEFRTGTGATNAAPLVGPVVINEIMFNPPPARHEFIEFCNVSSTSVDLGGWVVTGAAFTFPSNTVITPGGYLVLVGTTNVSDAEFRATNQVPVNVPVLMHRFELQNDGENLALSKPNDDPLGPPILVDRVRYNDKSPWPTEADGEGPSLERISPSAYGNDPVNWRSTVFGGSPGRPNVLERVLASGQESSWRYHARGHDLGSTWRELNYSDSGWPSGDGALGYGHPSVRTVITNQPGATGRPVTTYFRKEVVVHDPIESLTRLQLRANYDDGFVAYLNGQEILRRSMPAGAVSADTVAFPHAGGSYETFDLTEHKEKLLPGGNVLAVEVHQQGTNDTTLLWDGELSYEVSSSTVVLPFNILGVRVEAGIVVEWAAQPGATYRVERTVDLLAWESVSPPITASTGTAQFTDTPMPGGGAAFYRVRVVD